MVRAIVVKGHLVDSRRVELEESVDAETREVEIIVRVAEPAPSAKDGDSVASFLRSLPPGDSVEGRHRPAAPRRARVLGLMRCTSTPAR